MLGALILVYPIFLAILLQSCCVAAFQNTRSRTKKTNFHVAERMHGVNFGADRIREIGVTKLSIITDPSRRDEAWRQSPILRLFPKLSRASRINEDEEISDGVRALIDEQCTRSCMVFINGLYSAKFSNMDGVAEYLCAGNISKRYCTPVDEVSSTIYNMSVDLPEDLNEPARNQFGSNYIASLNMAQSRDMACVFVPAGVQIKSTVQVLFCQVPEQLIRNDAAQGEGSKGSEGSDGFGVEKGVLSSYPRLNVILGEGSSLRLKQSHHSISPYTYEKSNHYSFAAGSTRIQLRAAAQMQHTYVQGSTGSHTEVIVANLTGSDSRYDLNVLQYGANASRINVHIDIQETQSNCTLNGVTLSGRGQSLDLHSSIRHNATAGVSRQQHRNIVGEGAEAIFKGRIRIPSQAQRSDSDQLCKSIMLGQRAHLHVMPTLEISADDIACSHGASVTDLDDNSVFYLAARGISRLEARRILLHGFVFDLLKNAHLDGNDLLLVQRKLHSIYSDEQLTAGVTARGSHSYVSM